MKLDGVKDAQTGVYTLAYFGDLANREIDRAERYRRRFSLLTLHQPSTAEPALDTLPPTGAVSPRELAAALSEAVRDSDVVARVEESEFFVLLPETGLLGAMACRRRVIERLLATAPGPLPETGVAVYPTDGVDLSRLIRTSRRRAARALGPAFEPERTTPDFWQMVETLLKKPASAPQAAAAEDTPFDNPEGAATRQISLGLVPRAAAAQLAGHIVRTAGEHQIDGTLYAFGDPNTVAAIGKALDQGSHPGFRALCLTHNPADPCTPQELPLRDPRLANHVGLLALTDASALALLAAPVGDGELQAYLSSDIKLVDSLLLSLQRCYHLQPGGLG